MSEHIKTWQVRCNWSSNQPATVLMVQAMKEEIAELRAELPSRCRAQGGITNESGTCWNCGLPSQKRSDRANCHVCNAPFLATQSASTAPVARRGSASTKPLISNGNEAQSEPISASTALGQAETDATRFRQAIERDDNAEILYAAVMNHAPDSEAIRSEFDSAIAALSKEKPE